MDKYKNRLPKYHGSYLASNGVAIIISIYNSETNIFHNIGGVTHWCKLPELPIKRGDKMVCVENGKYSIKNEIYSFLGFNGNEVLLKTSKGNTFFEFRDFVKPLKEYREDTINNILN